MANDLANASAAVATAEDWAAFLKPIAMAVRNTPTDAEFRARVVAIASAVPAPAAWLSQPWRRTSAMRKFQFWPSVADMFDFFEPEMTEERERMARRRDDVSFRPPPAPEPKTAEVIAAVRRKAAYLVAELRAERPEDRAERNVRALHHSDGMLLEKYREMAANGNGAAAMRVAALERKLGMDE